MSLLQHLRSPSVMDRLHLTNPDEDDKNVNECRGCKTRFGMVTMRKHHCGRCGRTFCDKCLQSGAEGFWAQKVCTPCFDTVRSLGTFVKTYSKRMIDNTCELVGSVPFKVYSRRSRLDGTDANVWLSQNMLLICWQNLASEHPVVQAFYTHGLERVTQGLESEEFHSRQYIKFCCIPLETSLSKRRERLFSLHFAGGETFDLEAPSGESAAQFAAWFRELITCVKPIAVAKKNEVEQHRSEFLALEQQRVVDLQQQKIQQDFAQLKLEERNEKIRLIREKSSSYHALHSTA